jgi:hypothetical protein
MMAPARKQYSRFFTHSDFLMKKYGMFFLLVELSGNRTAGDGFFQPYRSCRRLILVIGRRLLLFVLKLNLNVFFSRPDRTHMV